MTKQILPLALFLALAIFISGCIEHGPPHETPPESVATSVYGTLLEVIDSNTFKINAVFVNCKEKESTINFSLRGFPTTGLKPEALEVGQNYSFVLEKGAYLIEKIGSAKEFAVKNKCFNPAEDISTEYLDAVVPLGIEHTGGNTTAISSPGGLNSIDKGKDNSLNFRIKNDSYFDTLYQIKEVKLVGKKSTGNNELESVDINCKIEFDDKSKTLDAKGSSDFTIMVNCPVETQDYSFLYLTGKIDFTGPDGINYTVKKMTSKTVGGLTYIHSLGYLTPNLVFGSPTRLEIEYPTETTQNDFYLNARFLDGNNEIITGADVRIDAGCDTVPFDYIEAEQKYSLNLSRQANSSKTYKDVLSCLFSQGEHSFVISATKNGYATAQKAGTVKFG